MTKISLHPNSNKASSSKADRANGVNAVSGGPSERPLLIGTACAVALPLMCGYQQPPSPAFFSQALAIALWAGVLAFITRSNGAPLQPGNTRAGTRLMASPIALWSVLLVVLLVHGAVSLTPAFVAAPIALNLTVCLLLSIAIAARPPDRARFEAWLRALLVGVLTAALFNAFVALVQIAAPNWADDAWIARMLATEGRASGNLRQPNQLASLMIWGLLAVSYLWRMRPAIWIGLSIPLLLTLLATGSRAGVISLFLIAGTALLRSRRVRLWRIRGWFTLLLVALPVVWIAQTIFFRSTADAALAQRLALWRNVVEIISQNPWFGVGWGQLNFAWTLTPLEARAADVFDHAHSLPLHLAAELGVPLATLVLCLLGASLWQARSAFASRDGATAALMLATILLHSLFEYPLWFSYFLLPAAFILAWLMAAAREQGSATSRLQMGPGPISRLRLNGMLSVAATLVIAVVLYASREYQKAIAIHSAAANHQSVGRAIDLARASPVFGHFGDYAAIMLAGDEATADMFRRPIRHVLDERLLSAYARMLARTGDDQRAAFVAARAREFPADPAFASLPAAPASSPAAGATFTVKEFRR